MGGTCCTTRDKSNHNEIATKKNGDSSANNEVLKSLQYLNNYLEHSKDKHFSYYIDREA